MFLVNLPSWPIFSHSCTTFVLFYIHLHLQNISAFVLMRVHVFMQISVQSHVHDCGCVHRFHFTCVSLHSKVHKQILDTAWVCVCGDVYKQCVFIRQFVFPPLLLSPHQFWSRCYFSKGKEIIQTFKKKNRKKTSIKSNIFRMFVDVCV